MKKLIALLSFILSGFVGVVAADVTAPSGRFLQIRETLQPSSTVYFSSGTVQTYLSVNGIMSLPHSATPPPTDCDEDLERGRIYVDTNATSGKQIYACEGTLGWILQGDGGGSGGVQTTILLEDGGSSIVNTSTVNFTGGSFVVTNDSGEGLVAIDFSTIPSRADVILNRDTLQSGATFYVSSGTVAGQIAVTQIKFADGTVQVSSATPGVGSTPSGSNTNVQFNDSGAFGGESNFSWDKSSDTLTILGNYDNFSTENALVILSTAATGSLPAAGLAWGYLQNAVSTSTVFRIVPYQYVTGTSTNTLGRFYALGSGTTDLVMEIGRQAGATVPYINLPTNSTRLVFNGTAGSAHMEINGTTGDFTLQPTSSASRFRFNSSAGNAVLFTMDTASNDGEYTWDGATNAFYFYDDMQLQAQNEIRLADSDSSNYTGFKASGTVASNVVFVVPPADGTSGQAVVTDGNRNLSFATIAGGSGGSSALEVFSTFDGTRSSPTASISIGDALKLSVTGSTAVINVDPSSATLHGHFVPVEFIDVSGNGDFEIPLVDDSSTQFAFDSRFLFDINSAALKTPYIEVDSSATVNDQLGVNSINMTGGNIDVNDGEIADIDSLRAFDQTMSFYTKNHLSNDTLKLRIIDGGVSTSNLNLDSIEKITFDGNSGDPAITGSAFENGASMHGFRFGTGSSSTDQGITIGDSSIASQLRIYFDTNGNDGDFVWRNSNDQFEIADNVRLDAQKELRYSDSDSSNYTALKSSSVVSSNVTLVLPPALPSSNGQSLVGDTNGDLYFATGSGSGGVTVYPASATASFPFGFAGSTGVFSSSVSIQNASGLQFYDADNSNYIRLRSSGTIPVNSSYVLPRTTGTADQVLAIQSTVLGEVNTYWKTDTDTINSPSGSDNYIQFYDSGAFGSDKDLDWSGDRSTLKVGVSDDGSVAMGEGSASGDLTLSSDGDSDGTADIYSADGSKILNIEMETTFDKGTTFGDLATFNGAITGNSVATFNSGVTVNASDIVANSTVAVKGQRSLRLFDFDNSHYVAFRSSAVVTSSNTYILPPSSGTANQAIITDGANNLSFGKALPYFAGAITQVPFSDGANGFANDSLFGYFTGVGILTAPNIAAQTGVQYYDDDFSNYVELISSAVVPSNVTYVLPVSSESTRKYLTNNNYAMSFSNPIFNPRRFAYFYDEFTGNATTAGDYSWSSQASGTGASVTNVGGEQNHPGVRTFITGTSTGGLAGLNNRLTFIDPSGGDNMEFAIKVSTDSGVILRAGIGDTSTISDNTDGYWVEISSGVSNWVIATANSGTRTRTTTSLDIAPDTWYNFRIVVNSANTSVEYFANDVSIGTITTNLPLSSDDCGGSFMFSNDGTASTSATASIDYVYWHNSNLNR